MRPPCTLLLVGCLASTWPACSGPATDADVEKREPCACELEFEPGTDTHLNIGSRYRFSVRNPCIKEDDMVLAATRSTVRRMYKGSPYPFDLLPEKPDTITLWIYSEGQDPQGEPLCTFRIPVVR